MVKENLTVMVVDASARAHAVSEAYERSPNVKKIIVTPGNDFIGYKRSKEVIVEKGKLTDPQSFLDAAQKHKPDLVDVCQDDALAVGTVDLLKANGFNVFGPTKAASRLEWDKVWSRDFMHNQGIPHPMYRVFSSEEQGIAYVLDRYNCDSNALLFIKASGLCAGKGAIPALCVEEAVSAIKSMKSFGDAGKSYLIEEGMYGEEASIYVLSDGLHFHILKPAQDNKRLLNNDEGPNTGGMGAVAPAGVITPDVMELARVDIVIPAIKGMHELDAPYTGVLYVGAMVTKLGGMPKVVEFNSRWGAPEAEVVVPGIQTPMDEIAYACINRNLHNTRIAEDSVTRVCVVGASRGYPGDVSGVKGKQIFGLDEVMRLSGIKVYGAGIAVRDNKFYANGGRLFSIVAEGASVRDAQESALEAMRMVSVEGDNLVYRTDIGRRDIERSL